MARATPHLRRIAPANENVRGKHEENMMHHPAGMALCLFFLLTSASLAVAGTGTVTAPQGANVRSAPGTGEDHAVLFTVKRGTPLHIRATHRDASGKAWYGVRLTDGREGWVAGWLVQAEDEATAHDPESPPLVVEGEDQFSAAYWFEKAESHFAASKLKQRQDALSELLKAKDALSQSIAIRPSAETYHYRAAVHKAMRDDHAAILDYTEAIKINERDFLAYNSRGKLSIDTKNYHRAIDDFNVAIRINEKYDEAYLNRGRAYSYIGEMDQAIRDIEKSVEINQNNPPTSFVLSAVDQEQKPDGQGAARLLLDPIDTCITPACRSTQMTGSYVVLPGGTNPGLFAMPFTIAVFSDKGNCARFDLHEREAGTHMLLVSPSGLIWRHENGNADDNRLRLRVDPTPEAGYYTLLVSGAVPDHTPDGTFTLTFGNYNSGNPNCANPAPPSASPQTPQPPWRLKR